MALVLSGLVAQEDVDLLLHPVLVVRKVSLRILLVDQTRKIRQFVNEVKQLATQFIIYSNI